jgi:ABC-2 type transport system permease protein
MIRAFVAGMRVHIVQFSRNPFDLAGIIVWPIVYATIAYYLLDSKENPKLLLAASLGAAVMLMWSIVVVGSSNALENQRWLGTLELLVAAPVPFASVIAPITVASGFVGGYSFIATLTWGRLIYGVPLSIAHPVAFVAAIPSCVLAIGMLGLVMASTFVLYRAAFSLGIAMQYPVWIATGLLVPLSLLPAFVGYIGWCLGPYWGFRAVREATLGSAGAAWKDIGMCLAISAVYLAIGSICLHYFERVARARGSLKLT